MEGSLNEIDICSILQLIELGQRTGLLLVEANNRRKFKSWFVFFVNGEIIYASDGVSSLSRVSDYLRHFQIQNLPTLNKIELTSLATYFTPEYGYVWMLLEENIINPQIARNIIYKLISETLFDLLSLREGRFIFKLDQPLAPQLTSWRISPLLHKAIAQLQQWKQLYPYVQSPEQFPVLSDIVQLNSELPSATVKKLQQWADGKTSLRQLARYLNRDVFTVAQAIYPYLQQGLINLLYASLQLDDQKQHSTDKKQRILCIDDTLSICEAVELILNSEGYEVQATTNSLEALSLVFQTKPDLIFCDLTMPCLDGYDFCAMLRRCKEFCHLPIIMLTSKDGFMDRLQAKMVGATDYLTKPFGNNELVILVKKYLD